MVFQEGTSVTTDATVVPVEELRDPVASGGEASGGSAPGDVALRAVDAGDERARWAMRQYFAELAERFPGGFDAAGALDDAAAAFRPPDGVFLLATDVAGVIGCGGMHRLDATTAEARRMWVHPRARGAGLGRRMLAALEEQARGMGCRDVVLDTNGVLTEAITLYRGQGYRDIPRYNDNPYAQHWFRKRLPDL
jgi:GNAT superfamily N-acetyltransferase